MQGKEEDHLGSHTPEWESQLFPSRLCDLGRSFTSLSFIFTPHLSAPQSRTKDLSEMCGSPRPGAEGALQVRQSR